jgi:hypothetical protein
MVLYKVSRSEVTSGFLIGKDRQDYISRGACAVGFEPKQSREKHRDASLHVQSASAPNESVRDSRLKGWLCPSLAGSRYDVDVPMHK